MTSRLNELVHYSLTNPPLIAHYKFTIRFNYSVFVVDLSILIVATHAVTIDS